MTLIDNWAKTITLELPKLLIVCIRKDSIDPRMTGVNTFDRISFGARTDYQVSISLIGMPDHISLQWWPDGKNLQRVWCDIGTGDYDALVELAKAALVERDRQEQLLESDPVEYQRRNYPNASIEVIRQNPPPVGGRLPISA
jgi:hypothetical protein